MRSTSQQAPGPAVTAAGGASIRVRRTKVSALMTVDNIWTTWICQDLGSRQSWTNLFALILCPIFQEHRHSACCSPGRKEGVPMQNHENELWKGAVAGLAAGLA